MLMITLIISINNTKLNSDANYYGLDNTDECDVTLEQSEFVNSTDNIDFENYFCQQDNYAIFTKNQNPYGLCWDFASNTLLELYLGVHYNYFIDFSEAWVAICLQKSGYKSNYNIESHTGANITYFYKIINEYGVMLESDMPYDIISQIDNNNYLDFYDFYKEYAIKDFFSNIELVKFDNYNKSSKKSQIINMYKSQIQTNGGVVVGINGSTTESYNGYSYLYNNSTLANHAVVVIGWDDNVTYKGHTGAWIAKNSWGTTDKNDGLFYIMYDDLAVSNYAYGFQNAIIASDDFSVRFNILSPEKFKNKLSNVLNDSSSTQTEYVKQKNIFNYGDNINLQLSIFKSFSIPSHFQEYFDIRLLRNNCDVSDNYNYSLSYNKTREVLSIDFDDKIESGMYKLIVLYSYNSNNNYSYSATTYLYVISGAEIGFSAQLDNGTICYTNTYATYSTMEKNIYVFPKNDTSNCSIIFQVASYSNILKVECSELNQTQSQYHFATRSSYAYGSFYFYINKNNYILGKTSIAKITFTTIDGYKYEYNIIINLINSDDIPLYVNYKLNDSLNTDGAENDVNNYKMYSCSNKYYSLNRPKNSIYYLSNWYYDKMLTEIAYDQNNDLGFCINKAKTSIGTTNTNIKHKYLFLYSKWQEPNLKFESSTINLEYTDEASVSFNPIKNGSGDYSYEIEENNYSENINFFEDQLIIKRLGAGNYTFNVTGIDNNYHIKLKTEINVNISKRKVDIKIDDKESYQYEDISVPSYTIVNGSILPNDKLNINLFVGCSSYSEAGIYEITGEYSNNNYEVQFQNGTYYLWKTSCKELVFDYGDIINYNLCDDTKQITKTLGTLPQGISLSNDCLVGQISNIEENLYNIFLLDNTNQTKEKQQYKIKVNPRKIIYKIDNIDLVYGQELPEITGKIVSGNVCFDDDLNIVLYAKDYNGQKGNYELCGTYNNSNYTVLFENANLYVGYIKLYCTIDNITSKCGEELKSLTYHITNPEKIVDINKLLIELTVDIVDNTIPGRYKIKAVCHNTNYIVEFTEAYYEII